MSAPAALAAYLRGRGAPAPNGTREEEEAALRAQNEALAASIGDRFLRPDIDQHLERAARRAAAEAPPGAVEETLAARGLLPEGLQTPRRFEMGHLAGRLHTEAIKKATRDAEEALPFLAARWGAVDAALHLLDEVEARALVWGWSPTPHRVIVMPRSDVAHELDHHGDHLTQALLKVLGDSYPSSWSLSRRWEPADAGADRPRRVRSNIQARSYIDNHVRWRHFAAARKDLGYEGKRWLADRDPGRRWPAVTFGDFPDPFAPMVDILRLGFGPMAFMFEFVLLVPEGS